MQLDPNKYSYMGPVLIAAKKEKPPVELCSLYSTVTHVPLLALLMLYDAYVEKDNKDVLAAIDLIREFYNYSEVTPVELPEVQKKN